MKAVKKSIQVLSIRKPRRVLNGVQRIARVKSETNPRLNHQVLVIDGTFRGRRRRTIECDCPDFFYRRAGRLRSCKHTRAVSRIVRGAR